ncbi:MAG: hypothetical protein C4308_06300 [Chitinophagaceae bacterium]
MQKKKPGVDVLNDLMVEILLQRNSDFVKSLLKQYHERGSLSKKQMQGLLSKAQKINNLPAQWLATLEAEIKKRPTRFRSSLPENKPLYEKDEATGKMLSVILEKFPEHKRVLFFKLKFENNEPLSLPELAELEKFYKVTLKK